MPAHRLARNQGFNALSGPTSACLLATHRWATLCTWSYTPIAARARPCSSSSAAYCRKMAPEASGGVCRHCNAVQSSTTRPSTRTWWTCGAVERCPGAALCGRCRQKGDAQCWRGGQPLKVRSSQHAPWQLPPVGTPSHTGGDLLPHLVRTLSISKAIEPIFWYTHG